MAPGGKGPGARRPSQRAQALLLAGTVLGATLFAGCFDALFPPGENVETRDTIGLLRVWIATAPGAIGREFAHYNVTYGPTYAFTDVHLGNQIALQSRLPTVDLVRMERDKLSAPMGQVFAPEGEYFGIATSVTRTTIAVDRIAGSLNGEPVVRAEETAIQHKVGTSAYRAKVFVIGGRTTDVFLEVDLQRSLQRMGGGDLHHTTILTRITVLVDGNLASQMPYDGGASRLEPNDPMYAEYQRQREIPLTKPPVPQFKILDPETEQQIYTNFAASPSKRLNRAVGLHQELSFDATSSYSSYRRGGEPVRITEHIWDFGDGTTARGATATKAYTEGGIYDIVLTVRDDVDLVASDHLTVFVPYTAAQAVRSDTDAASGTLYVPRPAAGAPSVQGTGEHTFQFPVELEDGQLRLGGYRVEAVARDPLGGSYAGLQNLTLAIESGHLKATASGAGPWIFETASVPVWRGPLSPWVTGELHAAVTLQNGLLVTYDLHVEALYYHNLSRGLDAHGAHIHSPWVLGPIWNHLDWDGTVARE